MRIAFITPEFPTEYRNGGGLGSYLLRMCQLLLQQGHVPEVFVTSAVSERLDFQGIVVHRVQPGSWAEHAERLVRISRWLPTGGYAIKCSAPLFAGAAALARSLQKRESEIRFDLIQSADYRAVGLFVPRQRRRQHIIRCSCAADLWRKADGDRGFNRWQCFWERFAIRRANAAYAPSRLVADHYRRQFGLNVQVIRPPMFGADEPRRSQTAPQESAVGGGRFHVHFGQLRRRKGTDFLAEALPLVWREAPDYRMVWAGGSAPGYVDNFRKLWAEHQSQITYVGAVDRDALATILHQAEASVLPSMVDNLPNTVIESLMCDRPVIGTMNSSIDELIADGKNGWLVEFGDTRGLAEAILNAWYAKPSTPAERLITLSPLWDEMQPTAAIESLLRFGIARNQPVPLALDSSL